MTPDPLTPQGDKPRCPKHATELMPNGLCWKCEDEMDKTVMPTIDDPLTPSPDSPTPKMELEQLRELHSEIQSLTGTFTIRHAYESLVCRALAHIEVLEKHLTHLASECDGWPCDSLNGSHAPDCRKCSALNALKNTRL